MCVTMIRDCGALRTKKQNLLTSLDCVFPESFSAQMETRTWGAIVRWWYPSIRVCIVCHLAIQSPLEALIDFHIGPRWDCVQLAKYWLQGLAKVQGGSMATFHTIRPETNGIGLTLTMKLETKSLSIRGMTRISSISLSYSVQSRVDDQHNEKEHSQSQNVLLGPDSFSLHPLWVIFLFWRISSTNRPHSVQSINIRVCSAGRKWTSCASLRREFDSRQPQRNETLNFSAPWRCPFRSIGRLLAWLHRLCQTNTSGSTQQKAEYK